MQWQHGTWEKLTNGSLVLTPFAPDGRQLMSDPCNLPNSIYTRYNVTELFEVRRPLTCCDQLSRETLAHLLLFSFQCPHSSVCKAKANRAFLALRTLHRPLPQRSPPQPLQVRRLPAYASLHRLQPASNATHIHPPPNLHRLQYWLSQQQQKAKAPHGRASRRYRGAHQAPREEGCGATGGEEVEVGGRECVVVVWGRCYRGWGIHVLLFLKFRGGLFYTSVSIVRASFLSRGLFFNRFIMYKYSVMHLGGQATEFWRSVSCWKRLGLSRYV